MTEIPKLNIDLNVEGWDRFGGKSYNVWGFVDFPQDLLKFITDYYNKPFFTYDPNTGKRQKQTGKRAPVWTAYDKYLYHDYDKTKHGNDPLPKISATFKSAFVHKYSPIVENLGMRVAMALDMPTSYNYIVSFNPEEYPEIVNNYPRMEAREELQPIGIVSIDFLQARQSSMTGVGQAIFLPKDQEGNRTGEEIDIDAFSAMEGDELLTFEDALRRCHMPINKLAGEENLIEKWIEVVDTMARSEYKHVPREDLNKMIDGIHSRIARSFLLKDIILGDCDFTAYNGGVVINSHKMRYAATHDYGDICNSLITQKLAYKPDQYFGMSKEDFEKLPPFVQEALKKQQANKPATPKSVSQLAREWASAASQENFYYVLTNFPEACREFFQNLDKVLQKNEINKIVDSYTRLTCNGTPLLSKEEAKIFKEYFEERISHFCDLYVLFLNKNHKTIPKTIDDDYEEGLE